MTIIAREYRFLAIRNETELEFEKGISGFILLSYPQIPHTVHYHSPLTL